MMFLKIKLLLTLTTISLVVSGNYSVYTSSGITEGQLNNKVISWHDIPYAQPPIDKLRWKAPKELISPNLNIEPKDGNFCIQKTSSLGGSSQFSDESISGTEDCLYLDIFAPKNSNNNSLPVMFWIHGGGNTSGLKDLYEFNKMVEKHEVIIVRINYRLGPFGWFTHPAIQELQDGIDKTSNFGTLDIIAALGWVKKNISLFGGDSNNVTIFGESAGGHNVYSLIASKSAEGLFHKAIVMSGYTTSISPQDAYKQEKDSATSDYTSWEVVNQMIADDQQKFTKEEIRDILLNTPAEDFFKIYVNRETYQELPLLTSDGIVIPSIGLRDSLQNKDFVNNVPLIAGSNADEVKLWLSTAEYFVDLDYSFIGSILGIPKVKLSDEEAFEAFNYYRSAAWKIRGVDFPLQSLSKTGNNKLYSYRFDWDDHRRFIVGDFKKLIGAAHATEIPLLAGNSKLVGGFPLSTLIYPPSSSKRYVSKNMMKFWANFAKYGSPGNSTNSIKWEPYDADSTSPEFIILDEKDNLKMSNIKNSFKSLSEELYIDTRVNDVEKCVILLQMFTFVGDDLYDQNINYYPGECDRSESENFLIDNASFIEY
jgi:para-nitrobenzyl esterase